VQLALALHPAPGAQTQSDAMDRLCEGFQNVILIHVALTFTQPGDAQQALLSSPSLQLPLSVLPASR
jgi:hypothetical protein